MRHQLTVMGDWPFSRHSVFGVHNHMPRLLVRIVVATLCLFAPLASAVQAADLTKTQEARVNEWAANNALWVLYHELAHLLVDQLDLPVLGKEEDAADNMASWTLLKKGTPEAIQALADAARGWQLSGAAYGDDFVKEDFYDSHSLNQQRTFQIVCLMVGADEESFGKVAKAYAMDNNRQYSCRFDYEQVAASFDAVLAPHWAKNSRGTRVVIEYNTSAGRLAAAAEAFQNSGVFEAVAAELETQYSIPGIVNFRAKRCGEENAFYDPNLVEIIFCYELMDSFIKQMTKSLEKGEVAEDIIIAAPASTGLGKADKNKR
ncbi:MAG: hypothetical protein JWR75_1823 [Devosia sp.]|nr:hypothetical protein [Devosia sp.]